MGEKMPTPNQLIRGLFRTIPEFHPEFIATAIRYSPSSAYLHVVALHRLRAIGSRHTLSGGLAAGEYT